MKLSAVGALSVYLPAHIWKPYQEGQQLGRVLDDSLAVYDEPSESANLLRILWKDLVVPVHEATLGTDASAYNRIWYQVGEAGYAYSGGIQPVELHTNPIVEEIPSTGRLAEVTVPFADVRWKPTAEASKAYRIYYATTHWVTGLSQDEQGHPWYKIYDDKWKMSLYAPASHLRLLTVEELSPLSPDIPGEEKRLEVRLADQMVVAYEGDQAVYTSRAATGGVFRNGSFTTPTGRFTTMHKRPFRHMAAGDRAAPNSYDLPGVPWVCYFTESGISFHGTYWHNDFGHPRSHGCVNLPTDAARWIYLWTLPTVPPGDTYAYEETGTNVDIL